MAHKDSFKAKGRVGIVVKDKDGKVKETRDIPNKVVDNGLAYIASRMVDANDSVMTHMALGTNSGSTAESVSNINALDNQIGSRKAFTTATSHSGAVVTYTCQFGTGEGTGAVKEAGIFSAATSGTMLCRTVFDVVNKDANDTMTITWEITLSDT